MNAEDTRTTPPAGDFEPHRLRTIMDMKRSRDDRLLGGVCSGAARHLDIDPVIVRVVIAVLTLVGFAGIIIYAAAWFLLPAEGEAKSVAAEWFKLDKNEEQVRIAGLVGAVVLATVSIIGDNGWFWDGFPWIFVPIAALFYLFVVRPRRRSADRAQSAAQTEGVVAGDHTVADAGPVTPGLMEDRKLARSRRDRSWTLTWLTASVAAIAVASTRIYAEYHDVTPWTTYIAVALGVVAIGLLVSTLLGNGGPLIGIGMLLAVALAIGSLLPSGRLGQQLPTPMTAAQVDPAYKHGIGRLELDLTDVSDPATLLGRTVRLRSAVGQIKVIVPSNLNVEVEAQLNVGQVIVFDRQSEGTGNNIDFPAAEDGPVLRLDIHERLGEIEVIRR